MQQRPQTIGTSAFANWKHIGRTTTENRVETRNGNEYIYIYIYIISESEDQTILHTHRESPTKEPIDAKANKHT